MKVLHISMQCFCFVFNIIYIYSDQLIMDDGVYIVHKELSTHIWQGNEIFYLTTHSTHFIYGYMASDIW